MRDLIDDCFMDGKKYNIKQIFVLTHNPYFHKDVSFYRIGDYKKVSFFEVRKTDDNISSIYPCEQECDNEDGAKNYSPVQNSYTALWNEYRDAQLPTTLLSVIRRIIEYHFIQLCSYGIDELRTRVFSYIGDDESKIRMANDILRFIYDPAEDEIHDIGDGMYFAADNDNESYKNVLEIVFKAMGQEQHYKKMSGEGESEQETTTEVM